MDIVTIPRNEMELNPKPNLKSSAATATPAIFVYNIKETSGS